MERRPVRQPRILRLIRRLRPVRNAPIAVRLVGVVAILAAAFAGRLSIEGVYHYPFITFFPAILVTSLAFGHYAGHATTILGAGLAFWFFVEPRYGAAFLVPATLLTFAVYLTVGALSSEIIDATVAALDGLDDANRALMDANRRLAEADAQKAALLDDINHRLKNSLHAIAGLLGADAGRASDAATRMALEAAAGRLRILARVHERLRLRSGAVEAGASVDMPDFLATLCADLQPTLAELRGVALRAEADSVRLDMSRAISVGLIVNELVTNAVRHGFPDSQSGTVSMTLRSLGGGRLCLEVVDDGIGDAADASGGGGGTGTRVVQALARQLGGSVERQASPHGTRVAVEFPEVEPAT